MVSVDSETSLSVTLETVTRFNHVACTIGCSGLQMCDKNTLFGAFHAYNKWHSRLLIVETRHEVDSCLVFSYTNKCCALEVSI